MSVHPLRSWDHIQSKGLIGEYTEFYRNQSSKEFLANYHSVNPQPLTILDENEFYKLYPNFNLDYIKKYGVIDSSMPDFEIFQAYHHRYKYAHVQANEYKKIVFYTSPYDTRIGGVNALYKTAHDINKMNIPYIKAYIYSYDHTQPQNRYCNNYISPYEIDKNTVVVYPETIKHNPLEAKNVVRWILLNLGYEMPVNFYENWQHTDLIYYWEPQPRYKHCIFNNIWIDQLILDNSQKAQHKERIIKSCFMFRKANNIEKWKPDNRICHDIDSMCLDGLNYENIINIFCNTKFFFSYDPNTFYNILAPLCGCITILLPPPNDLSKNQYYKERIVGGFGNFNGFNAGVAYGNSPTEIHRAEQTLPNALNQAKQMLEASNETLKNFVKDMDMLLTSNKLYQPKNTIENTYYANSSIYSNVS